jgi:acetyl esterase/lipase
MRIRLLVLLSFLVLASPRSFAADVKIEADVVYGHKDGLALTFDVVRPAKPNGAGILWIQSGGWYSHWVDAKGWPVLCKPYLDKGFTMFIVRHGSAPRYTVPEAIEDVRRCVRVIHLKAKSFGVDPERLGVFGASAGGHLSLMLGTTGDDGDAGSKDEVLRQSSRLAAVVAICPPTDLRGWTTNPPAAIKAISSLKPPLAFDSKKEPACSPLLKTTSKTAPTLLIHGDKDELVPIDHSKNMLAALEKEKVTCKLTTVEGGHHGFTPKQNQETVLPALLGWFEKHLAAKKGD